MRRGELAGALVVVLLVATVAVAQNRLSGGRWSGGSLPGAARSVTTPTFAFKPPQGGDNTATLAPSPTITITPTITATFTRTPTLPVVPPNCTVVSVPIAASADDATLTKIDFSAAWPPAGGTPQAVDVTGDSQITMLVQGASNTQGTYCFILNPSVSGPPCWPWPRVLLSEIGGLGAGSGWNLRNLAINNQSNLDFTWIGWSVGSIPWLQTNGHDPATSLPSRCATYTAPNDIYNFCLTSGLTCTTHADCPYGGASGHYSDVVATNPDVLILAAESNDSRWQYMSFSCPFPAATLPGEPCNGNFLSTAQQDQQAFIFQSQYMCDLAHTYKPSILCLYTTMHLAPYVAWVPWTLTWINTLNAMMRAQIPNTQLLDFDTNSSDPIDFQKPNGFDVGHAWQRPYTARGERAAQYLKKSLAATGGPSVTVETKRWNGVTGRSIGALKFNVSLAAGYVPVAASLQFDGIYVGRQDGQNAPATPAADRQLCIDWANSEAAGGWTMSDYPATPTCNAYRGPPTIGTQENRYFRYSVPLDNANLKIAATTGLFLSVTPDTIPDADTYWTLNVSGFDGRQWNGDGNYAPMLPTLQVLACEQYTPRVALAPQSHVAVVENIGDVKICPATPTPGPPSAGSNFICANPLAAPRGMWRAPPGFAVGIPALGNQVVRCKPGGTSSNFLCRTTPTPGSIRVKLGETGKALAFDRWSDWGMCSSTSLDYLCVAP